MKKFLSFILVVVMLVTTMPIAMAEGETYKVGDIIQFGSYPQSEVKDEVLIAELNAIAPEWDDWTSYGYYTGTGTAGSMVQGDWMRYTDMTYNGNKYRGVKFTQYRPKRTYNQPPSFSKQSSNGYYTDTVYWFKFEPIDWQVLEPNTGFVMCKTIIDSQPYNNTYYSSGDGTYSSFSDLLCINYASDYETSSIREWLNNDFYNVAFTDSEKNEIKTTTLNNDGYYTSVSIKGYEKLDGNETKDKIFILSFDEVRNSSFGFDFEDCIQDPARRAQGSDYAQSQGLYVYRNSSNSYNGNSPWLLRGSGTSSILSCGVGGDGYSYGNSTSFKVFQTDNGIRPALRLNNIADIVQESSASSYFVVSSDKCSVDSICRDDTAKDDTAKYKVNLIDKDNNYLSIDDVKVNNNTTDIISISTKKVSATELELTVKPKKDGSASISLFNGDNGAEQYFNFTVYSKTITYRADRVPVTNEKLKTNFSRGDMTVDNFSYCFDENKNKYVATMDVYNESGAIGVVAAYTNDGLITQIETIDPHIPFPEDYGEFLVYLGTGAVGLFNGENRNYRYAMEAKKTSIEIEVPEDGYITVSCDVASDQAAFIYNLISIGVDIAFKTADFIEVLGSSTDELAGKVKKSLAKKISDYFNENPKWIKDAMKKIAKKASGDLNIAYLEDIGMLSLDYLNEMFANIGKGFFEAIADVVWDITKKEVTTFGMMATGKKLIKEGVIGAAEESLLKALNYVFIASEYLNLINSLLYTFRYNNGTGKTMIVFKPKGQDGFISKDTVKVISDVITPDVLLNTYILNVSYLNDAFIRDKVFPEFNREDGLDERELNIDLNRIVEIHEISLYEDGVEIGSDFVATVEIELPEGINKNTCFVYREEKNGTCTKLKTRIEGNKIIFETDHFSHYILTGIRNDIEGTSPCYGHIYEEARVDPTCTQNGHTVYTCICGDSYAENIPAKGHSFNGSVCTECDYDKADDCSCNCHKKGISGFIWKILNFFYKLFRINSECACGAAHY